MKRIAIAGTLFCVIGFTTATAGAEEVRERCQECPRVTLVKEGNVVHVVSEDDRDEPDDLTHRVRLVIDGEPADWTHWGELTSYRVRTRVSATVEAESRDLEGYVGTGVIEVAPPTVEEGSIGPTSVAEDGTEDKRWSDDATTPDDGSRPPEEPEIEPYSTGDSPWDPELHGECPPTDGCNTSPSDGPRWPPIAVLLLVAAGLLVRRATTPAPVRD